MKTCSLGALLLVQETQEIGSFPMNGKMKSRKKRSDLDSHLEYVSTALIIHAPDAASNMHNSYPKKLMKNDHMNLNIHGV